jgi:hypothetical protein
MKFLSGEQTALAVDSGKDRDLSDRGGPLRLALPALLAIVIEAEVSDEIFSHDVS